MVLAAVVGNYKNSGRRGEGDHLMAAAGTRRERDHCRLRVVHLRGSLQNG